MLPTGPIRAHIRDYLRCLCLCLRKLRSLDILSESFRWFAKESHVKACFRLDLYGLTYATICAAYELTSAYIHVLEQRDNLLQMFSTTLDVHLLILAATVWSLSAYLRAHISHSLVYLKLVCQAHKAVLNLPQRSVKCIPALEPKEAWISGIK